MFNTFLKRNVMFSTSPLCRVKLPIASGRSPSTQHRPWRHHDVTLYVTRHGTTGGPVRQNLRLENSRIDFSAFKFTVLHDWSLKTTIDIRILNEAQDLSGKFLISYRYGGFKKTRD
jgi:hypothetical protein